MPSSLPRNEITDAGAGSIAAALRGKTALMKLDLRKHTMPDAGKAQLRGLASSREPAREFSWFFFLWVKD